MPEQASKAAGATLAAAQRREKDALDRAQFLEDERDARETTLSQLQTSFQQSQQEACSTQTAEGRLHNIVT